MLYHMVSVRWSLMFFDLMSWPIHLVNKRIWKTNLLNLDVETPNYLHGPINRKFINVSLTEVLPPSWYQKQAWQKTTNRKDREIVGRDALQHGWKQESKLRVGLIMKRTSRTEFGQQMRSCKLLFSGTLAENPIRSNVKGWDDNGKFWDDETQTWDDETLAETHETREIWFWSCQRRRELPQVGSLRRI